MTADLATVLERAAAFLRALEPFDFDEPKLGQDDGQVYIYWDLKIWTALETEVIAETTVAFLDDGRLELQTFEGMRPTIRTEFAFDGATVPPEIVAAIRRVTGSEGQ